MLCCGFVNGNHVHPHAFRKYVVCTLSEAGNDLATISKFIGHSSVNMTNHYMDLEQHELVQKMTLHSLLTVAQPLPPLSDDVIERHSTVDSSLSAREQNLVIATIARMKNQIQVDILCTELRTHLDEQAMCGVFDKIDAAVLAFERDYEQRLQEARSSTNAAEPTSVAHETQNN